MADQLTNGVRADSQRPVPQSHHLLSEDALIVCAVSRGEPRLITCGRNEEAQVRCKSAEARTNVVVSPGISKIMDSGVVAMKDVYKVRESASKLDVSVRTVYRLIRLGELKIVKVGRSTRVTARSIDEFIKKGGTA